MDTRLRGYDEFTGLAKVLIKKTANGVYRRSREEVGAHPHGSTTE